MVKMKYFQQIGHIHSKYEDLVRIHSANGIFGSYARKTLAYNYNLDTENPAHRAQFNRELAALDFLISTAYGFSVTDDVVYKPEKEDLEALFLRYMAMQRKICQMTDSELKRHSNPVARKTHRACSHYLFLLSMPAFYKNLPASVAPLPDLANEPEIPITFN